MLDEIRASLVSAVVDLIPSFTEYSLAVEFDNREVINLSTQEDPYLLAQIKLIDGEQASLGDDPLHRIYGQLYLAARVKKSHGVAVANRLLSHFYPSLQNKQFGTVRVQMATFAPEKDALGWVTYPLILPFWSDKTYGA